MSAAPTPQDAPRWSSMRGRRQVVLRRARCCTTSTSTCRRRGPRPRRRERRRQVDPDEDPRRGPPRRRRHRRARRRARARSPTPARRSGPASPPSSRSSTSCPSAPWPRTCSSAASRRRRGLVDRRAMVRADRRAARRTSACTAFAAGPRSGRLVGRRAAGRRDRQGDVARRPGHLDGRADRGPGRPEVELLYRLVRRLPERGVAVLYVSHRLKRDLRPERPDHRAQGRRLVDHRRHRRRSTADGLVRLMVGRELDGYFPPRGAERRARRRACCAVRGGATQKLDGIDLEVRGRRDRRPRRPAGQRPHRDRPGRSSASTPFTRGAGRGRRRARPAALAPRGGPGRHRPGLRGPQGRGPVARPVGARPTPASCSTARSARARAAGPGTRIPEVLPLGRAARRAAATRRSASCRAATSRRSCWPSGWPPSRVIVLDEPTRGIDVGAKAGDLRADARPGAATARRS